MNVKSLLTDDSEVDNDDSDYDSKNEKTASAVSLLAAKIFSRQ